MNKREAKKEARRREILAAATAVFAQKGFAGASMDDIVQASGLSKGGLYWHFKSKDDLIAAILSQFFSQEIAALTKLTTAVGSASDKLQLFGQLIISDVNQMAQLLAISLEFYALAARRETVRQELNGYFRQYQGTLAHLIQTGIDIGEFSPIIVASEAALNLIAQFEGLVLLWAIQGGSFDLEHQVITAVSLFLTSIQQQS